MTSRIRHLSGQQYIACVGDSKTVDVAAYPYQLISYLEGRTAQNWNIAFHHAVGGWTVENALSGLSAALALTTHVPKYIFVNLGTNEANDNPLPSEGTWKTNYASLLDQLHAKWPSAHIYLAHVWRDNFEANCSTLNSWIDAVIADGRSDWTTVAFDEADWLPDWTLDGTHPDARVGGYSEMARQFFAALTF